MAAVRLAGGLPLVPPGQGSSSRSSGSFLVSLRRRQAGLLDRPHLMVGTALSNLLPEESGSQLCDVPRPPEARRTRENARPRRAWRSTAAATAPLPGEESQDPMVSVLSLTPRQQPGGSSSATSSQRFTRRLARREMVMNQDSAEIDLRSRCQSKSSSISSKSCKMRLCEEDDVLGEVTGKDTRVSRNHDNSGSVGSDNGSVGSTKPSGSSNRSSGSSSSSGDGVVKADAGSHEEPAITPAEDHGDSLLGCSTVGRSAGRSLQRLLADSHLGADDGNDTFHALKAELLSGASSSLGFGTGDSQRSSSSRHRHLELPSVEEQAALGFQAAHNAFVPHAPSHLGTLEMDDTQPLPQTAELVSPGVTALEAELREITASRDVCNNCSTHELLAEEVRTLRSRLEQRSNTASCSQSRQSSRAEACSTAESPATQDRADAAATKIQAAARGCQLRARRVRTATQEAENLRQEVDYERRLLPQIVAASAIRQASLRSELVSAQKALDQSEIERIALCSSLARAEAESASLRSELAGVTMSGRRSRGGG
eukprot:TRINITY_DN34819_c0_g1_i1.p1 TRINITY_DN34819_c0_g1~~TRINITY_DN34819_c0_g1_i1.p1  ORF type:complete len:542 (-),score=111.52 TRINITY_DN34819_c0_g1_i1:75-1700(-)